MISAAKAKEIVTKVVPLSVELAFTYKGCYVFSMPDPKSPYGNPFYAVSTKTGKVRQVSPGEDFDGFFDALEHNQIEV